MSNLKHTGMTKQPFLLELNNLGPDTSSEEVRNFVVENFLMTPDESIGPGVDGVLFLKPNLAKKFALEDKPICVKRIKLAFRREECLGVAAIELAVPDVKMDLAFNPNDRDEIEDYLLNNPGEKQYVQDTDIFLRAFLSAISDQLNEIIDTKNLDFRGLKPHFSRITGKTVRYFMVKKGSSGGSCKKAGPTVLAPTMETLAQPKGAKLTLSNLNVRRQQLGVEFLSKMKNQKAAREKINKRFAELSSSSAPFEAYSKNSSTIKGGENWNNQLYLRDHPLRKQKPDEIFVYFMDTEIAYDNNDYAVPQELAIIHAAITLIFKNEKTKTDVLGFKDIRILGYRSMFFDPAVPQGFKFDIKTSPKPVLYQRTRHNIPYEGTQSPESLNSQYQEILNFLTVDLESDLPERVLIYSHNPLIAMLSLNFLDAVHKNVVDDTRCLDFGASCRDITDLLWVNPAMLKSDIEAMPNKILPCFRDYPLLYNKDAQCMEHNKMREVKKLHCALEDASSMFTLIKAIASSHGNWPIAAQKLKGVPDSALNVPNAAQLTKSQINQIRADEDAIRHELWGWLSEDPNEVPNEEMEFWEDDVDDMQYSSKKKTNEFQSGQSDNWRSPTRKDDSFFFAQ